MSRQITPATHARIAMNSIGQFAKPGESQADSIKRYMKKLRADQRRAEPRQFPNDHESLSSTKAYVEKYYARNFGADAQYVHLLFGDLADTPTSWPESDEVEVEELVA